MTTPTTAAVKADLQAARAGPQAIAGALASHGAVVLRRMLRRDHVQALRAQVVHLFSERDAAVGSGRMAVDHPAVRHDSFTLDDFRIRVDDTGPLDRICDAVRPKLASCLAGDLAILGNDSRIKRQHPRAATSLSPFHQDIRFVKAKGGFTIAWIPLDACGETAPGLEILPRPLDRALAVIGPDAQSANPNYAHIEIAPQTLESAMGSSEGWQPVFEPGDVCLQDGFTVHRTHVSLTMDQTRLALVLRYLAA